MATSFLPGSTSTRYLLDCRDLYSVHNALALKIPAELLHHLRQMTRAQRINIWRELPSRKLSRDKTCPPGDAEA
jgi:hypothetical protein